MPACRDETGACYAIDIGGTNFRVVYYKLSDKRGVIVSSSSSSRMHQSLQQGSAISAALKRQQQHMTAAAPAATGAAYYACRHTYEAHAGSLPLCGIHLHTNLHPRRQWYVLCTNVPYSCKLVLAFLRLLPACRRSR